MYLYACIYSVGRSVFGLRSVAIRPIVLIGTSNSILIRLLYVVRNHFFVVIFFVRLRNSAYRGIQR